MDAPRKQLATNVNRGSAHATDQKMSPCEKFAASASYPSESTENQSRFYFALIEITQTTTHLLSLSQLVSLSALVVLAAAAPAADDASATILTQENSIEPDGKFAWKFSTSNGIQAEESGQGGQSVQGSASWVGDDGVPIVLTYTADENGYHPQGVHLPTPPPIPDYILRALKYIEAHSQNN
ncbi:pupal cuticle protein Edg-78E-like [Topomyia yanbarensis]|uniref:pupal cuticle protein Edg-78E-like n=1 Tax=Topomyia yanbarensis TaxID=2498891 RepID=UPI00273C391A|nr:pupal cuticle protein Edg-78E-like [Topomyia yanbarensis]